MIKTLWNSERAMRVVDVVFFLALFTRIPGVIVVAYALWIVLLVRSIRRTQSPVMKGLYGVLIVFAAVMLVLNAAVLLRMIL